jgi:hypothetical protein
LIRRDKMNIYLIWQNEVRGYDTYDSAVVVAESEEEAKEIHPSEVLGWESSGCWATSPDNVRVGLIGKAEETYTESGVVCY